LVWLDFCFTDQPDIFLSKTAVWFFRQVEFFTFFFAGSDAFFVSGLLALSGGYEGEGMKEIARYWRQNEVYRRLGATQVDLVNPGKFVFLGGRIFEQQPDGKLIIPEPDQVHQARKETILFQTKTGKKNT